MSNTFDRRLTNATKRAAKHLREVAARLEAMLEEGRGGVTSEAYALLALRTLTAEYNYAMRMVLDVLVNAANDRANP